MFSFHKPKVYRSTQGCCICKAKSSSSRFTDSKRYEIDFIECFQLEVPRQGEICNACVLLVKRFKRLPPGSERHWGHVVDARVGPGLKSMTKFKKRCEENGDRASPTENIKRLKQEVAAKHAADAAAEAANPTTTTTTNASSTVGCTSSFVPQKFRKIFRKTKKKKPAESHGERGIYLKCCLSLISPVTFTDENMRLLLANGFVQQEMMALEEQMRMTDEQQQQQSWKLKQRRPKITSRRRKDYVPRKNSGTVSELSAAEHLMDSEEWRRMKTCCGFVLEHRELSALVIDLSTMNVCNEHQRQRMQPKLATPALKKHHLYLNRALLNASPIPAAMAMEKPNKPGVGATATVLDLSEKLAEFSKGIVQRVAENNKFSDNSSDSGYEELSSVPDVVSGINSAVNGIGD